MKPSGAILAHAPHLPVLDIVDCALHTAGFALIHDFPSLQSDPHPWCPESPEEFAARRLLRQIGTFARAVRRYRRVITASIGSPSPSPNNDDIDF